MNEHIHIWTDSLVTIQRMSALLQEHNIPTLVKDHVESARVAGFGISANHVELYVLSSDLEAARQVLTAFKEV